MSKNPKCNEQEVRDIIQCYLDSDKKVDLCQINYNYRYPRRKKPSLRTIKKLVQTYLKRGAASSKGKNNGKVSDMNAIKDYGILKYFLENTHASVKKAASIFHVKSSYIEQLLEEKKAQIESKNEDNEMSTENISLDDCIKGLGNSKKDQARVIDETLESNITIIEENIQDSQEIKTEIDIFEHYSSDITYQERNKESEKTKDFQNINSKKRKPETFNSKLNKKSKSYLQKQTEDPTQSEIPFLDNLLVYTTRLEDMAILKGKMKKFTRAHVIKEILLESKPKFYHSSRRLNPKLTIRKRRCLNSLQKKLKYLSENITHPVIDLIEEDSLQSKFIIHSGDPCCGDLNLNVKSDINQYINYKCNIVIMINCKSLQLWDIYVIDSNGNVVEYHTTKSEHVLNDIDPSKVRLKLYTCCWYQRRFQIVKTWPLCDTTFARFLIANHKCPPHRCACCCKPTYATSENSFLKNVCINARSIVSDRKFDSEKDKNNLINKALMYERKFIRNNDNLYVPKNDCLPQRFLFSEDTNRKGRPTIKTEFYEIGSKQHIIYQAIVFNTGFRVGTDVQRMLKKIFSVDTDKWNYSLRNCCKYNRDTFLSKNYSAGNISESVLRYLKNNKIPFICDNCKETKNSVIKNSNELIPAMNVPSIEHTKTLKVFKVGLENYKSYEQEFFSGQTLKDPSTEKSTEDILETQREEEMDQLELNCNQLPGLVFTVNNVQHQLAMAIVKKFATFDFTITKAQGQLVASINMPGQSISIQSISTDEFKFMSNILLYLQNRIQDVELPLETNLSLEVKIKADKPAFIQNCSNNENNHSSFRNILQNFREDTESPQKVIINKKSRKRNTKSSNRNHDNTRKTNDRTVSLQKIRADLNSSCRSINDTTLNEDTTSTQSSRLRDSTQNRKNKLIDSNCNQNIAGTLRNAHEVSQDSSGNISEKEITEKFYRQHHASVNVYNNFKNLMISNKKCSANSFRLYREARLEERTDNERTPLIVNVFSLKHMNSRPNEHLPSTSNAPVTKIIAKRNEPLPSTSKDTAHVSTETNGSLFSIIEDVVRIVIAKTNKSLPLPK